MSFWSYEDLLVVDLLSLIGEKWPYLPPWKARPLWKTNKNHAVQIQLFTKLVRIQVHKNVLIAQTGLELKMQQLRKLEFILRN